MTRPLQLAEEVLRLDALATKGEWKASGSDYEDDDFVSWDVRDESGEMLVCVMTAMGGDTDEESNAAFIALSRTAAPLLAQRVIEMEKAVREWVEATVAERAALESFKPWEGRHERRHAAVLRRNAAEAALRSLLADAGGEK